MIDYKQVEAGIYVYQWDGRVNIDEARQASEKLIVENDNKPFVGIVDMRTMTGIPTDIATMRGVIKKEVEHGLRGYVILGASRTIETFVKPLVALAPTTYKFAQEWDVALLMARDLLDIGLTDE